jgi:predicted XRE-type DNA-binding protein
MDPGAATIQALRGDLALQIARHVRRQGLSQVEAARQLAIPQPTVSKIMNGRVAELSLELLIRVAVRAGLPIVLQTGKVPQEAGVFVSGMHRQQQSASRSRVAESARTALLDAARQLTPEQRLQTHVKHSELVDAFRRAGRVAQPSALRPRKRPSARSRSSS